VRVLAVTHGPSVGPGVFADAVAAGRHELREWQVPLGGSPPPPPDAVIVLGGGMHPDEDDRHAWLRPELDWLAGLLERETPVLGVCLGAQLLARAAGAEVFRTSEPEVGWLPVELTEAAAGDPVAGALPQRFDAFQWHRYSHTLPEGAVELARSRVCLQAYRLGSAWGVQFHPEVRSAQIDAWLAEEPHDIPDPDALRAATAERIGAWNELGRRLCSAFLEAGPADGAGGSGRR
jgi:GMP synthase (glutamine-hydrolysing)